MRIHVCMDFDRIQERGKSGDRDERESSHNNVLRKSVDVKMDIYLYMRKNYSKDDASIQNKTNKKWLTLQI